MSHFLFTSESVTEGHPDKICDQISDLVLDEALKQDSSSKVACETLVTQGLVFIAGEMKTKAYIDLDQLVRKLIKDIGYGDRSLGFSYNDCAIINALHNQSIDISKKVSGGGAGDQGLMFGYASSETDQYMPMPIFLAHQLTFKMSELRKANQNSFLRPDGKCQVTIEYQDDRPVSVTSVLISTQHSREVSKELLEEYLTEEVIYKIIPKNFRHKEMKIYINPGGDFIIGGPVADCGLTGRKIIVGTYGGFARHGGGAFSGKDPTKVDRSASYMARYLAKNIVASKLCNRCEIQLSYAIGMKEPISIYLNTFSTSSIPDHELANVILKNFDLTPDGIICQLNLLSPIYRKTSTYGHFGRNGFSWEELNLVDKILSLV